MSIRTAIQWCDSTCNPAVGCVGCELHPEHCYAKAWCDRWAGRKGYPQRFEQPELFPGRIEEALAWSDLTGTDRPDKPWLNGMPRVIFLCDLGDPFTPGLPDDWLAPHIHKMAQRHIWILLSKWPSRMGAFVEWWQICERWPRNIWIGTSVTTGMTLDRVGSLLEIPVACRIVSAEPLLGPLQAPSFHGLFRDLLGRYPGGFETDTRIHWVITGGESGRRARPCQFAWLRRLVADARGARSAIFVKQLGSNPHGDWLYGDPPTHTLTQLVGGQWLNTRQESQCKNGRWKLRDPKGGDPREWPEDLQVREMPDWRKRL